MATEIESNAPLAVLIDADNANPSIIEGLLEEVAKIGVASVKRIYGDWTLPNLGSWKSVLLEYSIQPIQQFRYTTGKNATDSAMIIDAMDLLYAGHFAGFCLVSSDSDFTRLASRIRESGRSVYGFGERKTPRAFVSACDRFIYTEVLIKK
ncbi:MAG: NYN domain-containing protein [Chitinivibrionales bacterium]